MQNLKFYDSKPSPLWGGHGEAGVGSSRNKFYPVNRGQSLFTVFFSIQLCEPLEVWRIDFQRLPSADIAGVSR